MNDAPKPQTLSRREFGRRAAKVVAAALVQPMLIAPAEAAETPNPPAKPSRPSKAQNDEAVIDAKLADVVRKYGDRLSDDQRGRLRGIIRDNQNTLKRVRALPLNNDDSPATGLRLYPTDTETKEQP